MGWDKVCECIVQGKLKSMDKQAFIEWIKDQIYVGKGFREDEELQVKRLYKTLNRFSIYLRDKHGIEHIEDTTLDILRQFDFNYPDNDDQNLRLAFSYLGRNELAEFMGMVSADKYFRNKKLAVALKAMENLSMYVKDLRKADIRMASDLLERGATLEGRAELVAITGIPEDDLLRLVQCCDLCRMIGMGGETLRRAVAMGYDTLEKFRTTTHEKIKIDYNTFLREHGERSNRMVDFPSFVHQARRLNEVIVTI